MTKFESVAHSKNTIHTKQFLQISMIYNKNKGTTCLQSVIVCQVCERHFKTSWNIMTSFNVDPFHLYDDVHDGTVQRRNSNICQEYFSFMRMHHGTVLCETDPFKPPLI